jgi:thiamine biosynthesis protein ThiC
MSKMKEIDEIAQGIADVTKELMYDSIDWQLADFPQDGDEYNAIHSAVMKRAIEYLHEEVSNPLEKLPGFMGTEKGG